MNTIGKKLGILLVSPLPPPAGGIATWTELYLKSELIKKHNIKVVDISVRGNRINNFNKKKLLEEIKRNISVYNDLTKVLRTGKFDVVHLNTSCSKTGMIRDLLCARKIKKAGNKLVLQCHCNIPSLVNNKFSKSLFKRLIKNSDVVMVLNSDSSLYIKKMLNREGVIVSNFINNKVINESNYKNTANEIKTIIFVGHVLNSKGCCEIIEVAKFFPQINFRLVGNISEDFEGILSPKNVTFVGEISKDNVLIEMKNADLLLFPSHSEGFPLAVLEAMACGLPIIATPVGAIPDMVESSGGILVDVGDVSGMIKAIQEIYSPSIREQMSQWNQKKVKSSYTTEVVLTKICDIYEGI
ncbi:glycosyltransferase family 4 protein [Psychrobacillus sp. L3]|uniref:glycosyltransferase family 4 protein n=1 Tax=Psychrobacillus sp. L3 TaxID=3236891 RepID=UPI0036F377DA